MKRGRKSKLPTMKELFADHTEMMVIYMRPDVKEDVREIAREEGRAATRMATRLLELGIKAWKAKKADEERNPY